MAVLACCLYFGDHGSPQIFSIRNIHLLTLSMKLLRRAYSENQQLQNANTLDWKSGCSATPEFSRSMQVCHGELLVHPCYTKPIVPTRPAIGNAHDITCKSFTRADTIVQREYYFPQHLCCVHVDDPAFGRTWSTPHCRLVHDPQSPSTFWIPFYFSRRGSTWVA